MSKTFAALNATTSSATKLNPAERFLNWVGAKAVSAVESAGKTSGELYEVIPAGFGIGQFSGALRVEDEEVALCKKAYDRFIAQGATHDQADEKVAAYVLKYLR